MRRFLSMTIALLGLAALCAGASDKRLITIQDILNGTRVTGAELSPSGKYVLLRFTTTDTTSTKRTSVLRDIASGKDIHTFKGYVRWTPSSDALVKEDSSGVKKICVPSLDSTVICPKTEARGWRLTPAEDVMLLNMVRKGKRENPDVYQILEPDDRQPGWRDRYFVARLDLSTGKKDTIATGKNSVMLEDISPDGKRILLQSSRSRLTKRPTTVTDIMIMDLGTLKTDTLAKGVEFVEDMKFSPDGKSLIVKASPEAFGRIGEHIRPGQTSSMIFGVLYRMDIATGKVTPLTDRIPQSVNSFTVEDDGRVYFLAEDRDYVRVYSLNPSTGAIRNLGAKEEVVGSYSVSAGRMAYIGEGVSNSKRCHLMEIAKGTDSIIEDTSADLLKDIKLGEVHDWNYRNSRGDTIYGRFYLPPDFDPTRKYPMIVNYYGGCSPISRDFESRYPHPLYAAQGYVVYIVQPSGATGFGQEFAARHVNTWGQYGADDIIEGTKRFCAEHDFVDPTRIGCIGASFGGFMTQYLATVTDIFATGISHAGISDITSYWGEGYWGYSYCEVSTAHNYPWNASELMVRQSPLFNADKVAFPLMFLHGKADTNVPVGESIQMFTALKLLGKDTAFVVVEGQDHHILQYDKRLRWQETIFAWFEKYLKGDPSHWNAMYPSPEE